MNSFRSVSVITDSFICFKDDKYVLSTRGSNILFFLIAKNIQKKYGAHFEIYQPGFNNYKFKFSNLLINVIKSKNFVDYKRSLNGINFDTDIVHYNNIDLFNEKYKSKYVTATIHTNAFLEKESANKWLKGIIKQIDKVIVVNTEYLKEFKSVKLIRNGVPENTFKYDLSNRREFPFFNILFPNLDAPKKNRRFAIDLIRELNNRNKYKFRLLLTGEQENLDLQKDWYEFVGQKMYGEEMQTLYRESFITIIPSISESCSLCALESMSSGTPVIANNIYGISDYIKNDFNGYLVSVKDMDKWISQIYTLIEDRKEYRRIQQNARTTIVKEYNLERMANEYYLTWLNIFNENN